MIEIETTGSFDNTSRFLKRLNNLVVDKQLNAYGHLGVEELKKATPKRTGKTSESWTYDIEKKDGSISIVWSNTNVNNGVNIAIILQYGHATRNGSYVEGIDYINPALQSTFDRMSKELWKAVLMS